MTEKSNLILDIISIENTESFLFKNSFDVFWSIYMGEKKVTYIQTGCIYACIYTSFIIHFRRAKEQYTCYTNDDLNTFYFKYTIVPRYS